MFILFVLILKNNNLINKGDDFLKRVVVIYSNEDIDEISEICSNIVNSHDSVLPISPDVVFHYLDAKKPDEAEKKLNLAFNLISDADELWVFGDYQTNDGCKKQIKMAQLLNKNIRYWGKVDQI